MLSRLKKCPACLIVMLLIIALLACNLPPRLQRIPTPTIQPPDLEIGQSAQPTLTPFSPATDAPAPTKPKPAPQSSPLPTVAYQPAFEVANCDFPLPQDYTPQCGYLVVPEDRSRPDGTRIRLAVAVFRSISQFPAHDPVIFLSGGPGSSALDEAQYIFSRGFSEILRQRDFILFDQRGTGHSQPSLACPERDRIKASILEKGLSPQSAQPLIVESFKQCRDRLRSEGVDLSTYNSAASASDVDDLRIALGYEQVNLYGASYGTRLALTVMRDHPQGLRSVILDSTYPPQVNLYTGLAPNAWRAFNVLFEHCAADEKCNSAYPDLRNVFFNLVDQLNAKPMPVNVYDASQDANRLVLVNGDLLMDVLFTGLYNRDVTASMPKMIYQVQAGDFYEILERRLRLYFEPSTSLGMQMSVQCREEIPFASLQDAVNAAAGVQPQIASYFPASIAYLFDVCAAWGAGSPDPLENQPVISDIPTMILAGEYDPITPPEWGSMAAETLHHAYYFEFPGVGHWVVRSDPCSLEMALSFWEDPSVSPDMGCISTAGGLNFVR